MVFLDPAFERIVGPKAKRGDQVGFLWPSWSHPRGALAGVLALQVTYKQASPLW